MNSYMTTYIAITNYCRVRLGIQFPLLENQGVLAERFSSNNKATEIKNDPEPCCDNVVSNTVELVKPNIAASVAEVENEISSATEEEVFETEETVSENQK